MLRKTTLTTAILFFIFLALISNQAKSQVIPTNEWVNFYSMNAIFNGIPIPIGAEINAYDPDSVHCGTFTVTTEGQYGFMEVYRDDAITPDIDEGASPGDTITFTINGYLATPLGLDPPIWTFNGARLQVDLQAFSNRPPEVKSPISDIVMNEDDPDLLIADLDTIFFDPDNDTLGFTASSKAHAATITIDVDNNAILSLLADWNGSAILIFSADDASFSVHDTVEITVINQNDPPEPFNLIYPDTNAVLDTLNPTLYWEESNDIDAGDSIYYEVLIAFDSLFTNILIDSNVADSNYSIDSGFVINSQYYWKVYAIDRDSAVTSCNAPFFFKTSTTATNMTEDRINCFPNEFTLYQNHPNPFNPKTSISYSIPELCHIELIIYNMMGQEISTLVNEQKEAGSYTTIWNGKNYLGKLMPSGLYFYKIKAGNHIKTQKMMLLK